MDCEYQLQAARAILRNRLPNSEIERDTLCAHAQLSALCHHYPSQKTPEDAKLLNANNDIPEKEYSRWVKQRRLIHALR